jgi:sugar phosphate isomerase/epimerase
MFKLGIEILPYHDFPLEEALGEVARLGFSEVNLWSSKAPLAHHVNPGDDPRGIRALLQRYGMHPTALTMYGKTQEEMKLNFGPGEQQLPRENGTLDHRVLLRTLKQVGYEGIASLKCHGTAGWPLQKVTDQLARSAQYVRRCMTDL